jgi:prefoldin subunit 5
MESKEERQDSQQENKHEDPLLKVLVDKTKKNSRGVPTMNFIDNVEDWIDKFTSEKLISYINQYLNKYKFMEAQIVKNNEGLNVKIPDIEKCLETIEFLEKKDKEKPVNVDYMVSNNLWAKAEVNVPESVFLWLGANVMCEYKMDEAKNLLNQNLLNAKNQIKKNNTDLEFIKDQMTVCEVNIARVYNETVRRNQIAKLKKASEKSTTGIAVGQI